MDSWRYSLRKSSILYCYAWLGAFEHTHAQQCPNLPGIARSEFLLVLRYDLIQSTSE